MCGEPGIADSEADKVHRAYWDGFNDGYNQSMKDAIRYRFDIDLININTV